MHLLLQPNLKKNRLAIGYNAQSPGFSIIDVNDKRYCAGKHSHSISTINFLISQMVLCAQNPAELCFSVPEDSVTQVMTRRRQNRTAMPIGIWPGGGCNNERKLSSPVTVISPLRQFLLIYDVQAINLYNANTGGRIKSIRLKAANTVIKIVFLKEDVIAAYTDVNTIELHHTERGYLSSQLFPDLAEMVSTDSLLVTRKFKEIHLFMLVQKPNHDYVLIRKAQWTCPKIIQFITISASGEFIGNHSKGP